MTTAMPYIAAAVLAYSLLSSGGTKPSIEGGYSTAGDPGTNGKAYLNGYYGGALDASQKLIVDGLSKSYIETVKALGGKAGTFTASQFTGIDQNGHASAIDAALSDLAGGEPVAQQLGRGRNTHPRADHDDRHATPPTG